MTPPGYGALLTGLAGMLFQRTPHNPVPESVSTSLSSVIIFFCAVQAYRERERVLLSELVAVRSQVDRMLEQQQVLLGMVSQLALGPATGGSGTRPLTLEQGELHPGWRMPRCPCRPKGAACITPSPYRDARHGRASTHMHRKSLTVAVLHAFRWLCYPCRRSSDGATVLLDQQHVGQQQWAAVDKAWHRHLVTRCAWYVPGGGGREGGGRGLNAGAGAPLRMCMRIQHGRGSTAVTLAKCRGPIKTTHLL